MALPGLKIILASGSPRRRELLNSMDIPFEIVFNEVKEDYPENLPPREVPMYLAEKKAQVNTQINFSALEGGSVILLSADTVVLLNQEILGKPTNALEAVQMLEKLSGKTHEVITGVCLANRDKKLIFSDSTWVEFSELSRLEIEYYVDKYKPYDKAGAYGIQEWIGSIGIASINGSYTNVMGLPTEKLYKNLITFN